MAFPRLILAGGGSAADSWPLDRQFTSWLSPHSTILYLPIALLEPRRTFITCLEWLTQTLAPFGHTNIEMWTDLSDKTAADLNRFDAVYIGGGNTYWLLHQLRTQQLDRALTDFIQHGHPVYGGSAGAIILGRDIQTCAHLDQNTVGLSDTRGLDVVHNYAVWCHYQPDDDARIAAFRAQSGVPVLALSERAGVCLDGTDLIALGYEPTICFTRSGHLTIAVGERLPTV